MAEQSAGRVLGRKVLVGRVWISTVARNMLPFLISFLALYFLHVPRRSYAIVSFGLVGGAGFWATGLIYLDSRVSAAGGLRTARRRRKHARPLEIPPQGLFVGRGEETRTVVDFLAKRDDDGPRVAVLFGGPGMGKTALATHIAHEVSRKYTDGQFFIRLDRQPHNGTAVEAMMRSLLDGLDGSAPASSRTESHERFAQLRGNRRILFLLDDAAGVEDVRPLLGVGADCAILVTARERIDGIASALQLEVGPLPVDEAVELLGAVIGDERVVTERAAARRIAEAAAGQPLAIRLVGTSLTDEPYASLELAVERLVSSSESQSPDRIPPTALDLSVLSLTGDERRALLLLGMLSDPVFALWKLQALLETDEAGAWRTVDSLMRARLIERFSTDAAGTALFHVHEPVLEYARALLERETVPEQRASLQAALRHATDLRNRRYTPRSIEREILGPLESGDLMEALHRAKDAVTHGRDSGDRAQEATALAALAQVQCELGNLQEAEELARTASRMAEPFAARRALHCLGVLHRRMRQFAAGVEFLGKALETAVEEDDEETVRILCALATLQAESDAPAALATVDRARAAALAVAEGGAALDAGLLWTRGRVLRKQQQWPQAESALADGHAAAVEQGQVLWSAWTSHEIASCMFERDELTGAEQHAVQALSAFADLQHRYGVARCRLLLGRIFIDQDRRADASRVLGVALKDFQSCGDPWSEAESARVLAGVRAREDRSADAMRLFGEAASGFAQLDDEPTLILVYREWAIGNWLSLWRRVDRWRRRARPTRPARQG